MIIVFYKFLENGENAKNGTLEYLDISLSLFFKKVFNISCDKFKIEYRENGKPYIADTEYNNMVSFSISHSKNLWCCGIDIDKIGIDVEVIRERPSYIKVAERFFSQREIKEVKELGIIKFFEIWTRKEAFSKYTERGISENFKTIYIDDKNEIEGKDNKSKVETLFIEDKGILSVCTIEKKDIKIIKL